MLTDNYCELTSLSIDVNIKSVAASILAIFKAARFIKKTEPIVSKGLALALALHNCISFNPLRTHYKLVMQNEE